MPKIPESIARWRLAGKPVEFFLVDGIVLSNQRWSESHTYSAGVGSFHNTAIGYIALPQIKSYAVENQEIWLRLEIGKDISCRYSGQTIPVTSGQSISLIAIVIQENAYANVAIANHSTGLWHIIGDLERLVHTRVYSKPSWGKTFVTVVVGWLILGSGAGYTITGGAIATKAAINSPADAGSVWFFDSNPAAVAGGDRPRRIIGFLFGLRCVHLASAAACVCPMVACPTLSPFSAYSKCAGFTLGQTGSSDPLIAPPVTFAMGAEFHFSFWSDPIGDIAGRRAYYVRTYGREGGNHSLFRT